VPVGGVEPLQKGLNVEKEEERTEAVALNRPARDWYLVCGACRQAEGGGDARVEVGNEFDRIVRQLKHAHNLSEAGMVDTAEGVLEINVGYVQVLFVDRAVLKERRDVEKLVQAPSLGAEASLRI
jgi:hypothetical protein